MLVTIWGQLVEVTSHLQRPKNSMFILFDKTEFKHSNYRFHKKKYISEIFKSTRVIWRNVFLNKS